MARPEAIQPVSQDQAYWNGIVYADPGVGKTVFAGTSPKCLILADPNGSQSAALQGSKADRWIMNDWSDMDDAMDYVRHEGYRSYEWVWLDSGTLMQERGLDDIMEDVVARKSHRSEYKPDKPEYGENRNRISKWVRRMVAVPVNFGITALVLPDYDQEGNQVYMPYFQGPGLPAKICAYVDVVGYYKAITKDGKIQRTLYTQKTGLYYAKDRYAAATGGRLVNPTVPSMMAKVQGLLAKPKSSPPAKAPVKKVAAPVKVAAKKAPAPRKASAPRKAAAPAKATTSTTRS